MIPLRSRETYYITLGLLIAAAGCWLDGEPTRSLFWLGNAWATVRYA